MSLGLVSLGARTFPIGTFGGWTMGLGIGYLSN